MAIGDTQTIELREGMSMYWAKVTQTAVEGWEVRWQQHGRAMVGVGSTRKLAIDDARWLAREANR